MDVVVTRVRKTYLDVVAVSSPPNGLFIPKGSKAVTVIVFPVPDCYCCVLPSPPNTTNTYGYTAHCSHPYRRITLNTMCPSSAARDCLVPGKLDTSLQGDGFKLPADVAYLHAFTPVSTTLPFSSPFPTTSSAVPWSPLHPSFPRKYFSSSSLSSPSQHRIYPL